MKLINKISDNTGFHKKPKVIPSATDGLAFQSPYYENRTCSFENCLKFRNGCSVYATEMMVKNVLIFQDSRIVHHLGKYKKDFLIQYLLVVIFHENTHSLVVSTFYRLC